MSVYESELNSNADKLPSVFQWLKTVSKEATVPVRIVKVLWFPNLYNNYSLDTEAYRLRVSEGDSLYQVLEANLENWLESGCVIGLEVTGQKVRKIKLSILETDECDWDQLGEHGWKCSAVRPKTNPKSKTRFKSNAAPEPTDPQQPQEGASEK